MFYFEFCGFFVGRLIQNRYFKVRYSIPTIIHIFLSIRYWICNIFTENLSVIVTAVAQRRVYLRSAWSRIEPGTYISEAGRARNNHLHMYTTPMHLVLSPLFPSCSCLEGR